MKTTKKLIAAAIIGGTFLATSCSTDQESLAPTLGEKEISSDLGLVVAPTNNGDIIPGQYIIRLKDGSFPASGFRTIDSYSERTVAFKKEVASAFSKDGVQELDIMQAYSATILGFSAKLTPTTLESLKKNPNVDFIEPDRVIALAPPPGKGPGGGGDGGGSTTEETPWGITRVGGGADYTGSSVAWVIDSGIETHEDLNIDVSRGFNAFTKGKDADLRKDGSGHGTHVAGTIAAIGGNGKGVVGVAAGATVIPVKVLDSRGSGSYSGVIGGVDHVGANGSNGDVANMSLGGPISQALDDAILAASQSSGVKFVLAAGNESQNANNTSPARVNGSNIYTISASDSNDNFASFSNYANPPVDYCEPGVAIKSTYKGGGYATLSGTSMASPHAAGLLLLGNIGNGGSVNGDPDGNPDTIGVN